VTPGTLGRYNSSVQYFFKEI